MDKVNRAIVYSFNSDYV